MSDRPSALRFYEWFTRWRSPLRRFLAGRSAAPAADLDDMAQEVFLRLIRYSDAEVIEYPQSYLFKIATNVANEWAIRPRRRLAHDPRWLEELSVDDSIEQSLDDRVYQLKLKEALATLTTRERTVMKLHFDEGLTREQIASRLGVTERVVKREIERSFLKLRQEFETMGHAEHRHG